MSLKEKFRNCELTRGMHISLTDPSVTEMCGSIGFDFLWIDTEHTPIDYGCLQSHLIAAKAAGTSSIVRVPWNDPILAKRVLEQGPDGIIFPVVNTPEELDRAMKSTLYPPYGTRGYGPQRAAGYGLTDAFEYIEKKSMNLCRCIQIESKTAVKNLPEMVKNPWVDCFFWGPCDLSGSIGELNHVFEKNTQDLIKEGVKIIRDAGKSCGVSTGSSDPEVIALWRELGFNVLSCSTDYLLITSGAKKVHDFMMTLS